MGREDFTRFNLKIEPAHRERIGLFLSRKVRQFAKSSNDEPEDTAHGYLGRFFHEVLRTTGTSSAKNTEEYFDQLLTDWGKVGKSKSLVSETYYYLYTLRHAQNLIQEVDQATFGMSYSEKAGFPVPGGYVPPPPDPVESESVRSYRDAAAQGDAAAMNNLGFALQHGNGTAQDPDQAFFYFLKAARSGSPAGLDNVGYCYHHGVGIKTDPAQAFHWYSKAAATGFPSGLVNFAFCYQHGVGVAPDHDIAFSLYVKAAETGFAAGMNNVGYCYQHGIGTDRDYPSALAWYTKSAELGDSAALNSLGFLYQHGLGVAIDLARAAAYFDAAADAGNTGGLNNAAFLLETQDRLSRGQARVARPGSSS